jgi:hypothetical protein
MTPLTEGQPAEIYDTLKLSVGDILFLNSRGRHGGVCAFSLALYLSKIIRREVPPR